MYPQSIIGDIDLYNILLCIGVVAALLVYRKAADIVGIGADLFNFTLICAFISIIMGLFSAVLFQALYNIGARGAFIIDKSTGATFAGGLIGGCATFIFIYFVFGKKASKDYKKEAMNVINSAACSIPAAHGFGRIGCLMAGCCYGKPTDAFYGIYMKNLGYNVVPVQLFEAIFLFALFFLLIWTLKKCKRYTMSLYMILYGIWRFFAEFMRDDERGMSIIKALSPSQLIAIIMFIGGVALIIYERRSAIHSQRIKK